MFVVYETRGMLLTWRNRRKTCLCARLSTTNRTWTFAVVNSGLSSEKPAINRVIYGTGLTDNGWPCVRSVSSGLRRDTNPYLRTERLDLDVLLASRLVCPVPVLLTFIQSTLAENSFKAWAQNTKCKDVLSCDAIRCTIYCAVATDTDVAWYRRERYANTPISEIVNWLCAVPEWVGVLYPWNSTLSCANN
jgi:hypothetical protein